MKRELTNRTMFRGAFSTWFGSESHEQTVKFLDRNIKHRDHHTHQISEKASYKTYQMRQFRTTAGDDEHVLTPIGHHAAAPSKIPVAKP